MDRIFNNPLRFVQSNKEEVDTMDRENLIVLSNKKQKVNPGTKESKPETPVKEPPKPKSMQEAVAAYTGKKYGVKAENQKKRKFDLVDSEEDVGEEDVGEDVGEELGQEGDKQNEEKDEQLTPSTSSSSEESREITPGETSVEPDGDDENYTEPESPPTDSNYQSANEFSDDKDERTPQSEPLSESLSEEPEDLELLKQDLKRDEAENDTTKTLVETPPSSSDDKEIHKDFYFINELDVDRGSNKSKRINKSWEKSFLNKKPIGLLNQGVTCYMNTAIQSMIHIPALQNYLNEINNGKHNNNLKPKSVSHNLAELSARLWYINETNPKKKYIHPKRMVNRLEDINCMMSEWQQEDSHEYYMSLISRLQEDSTPKGKKLNSSIIYDIFGGLLNQIVICQNCKNKSQTKQEFYDLSLGFNKRKKLKYSIEKSIEDFFSTELIKSDKESGGGYYCEKCKKNTSATKNSTIDTSPETLTIHLKRFKFNGNQSLKMKQSIKYPNFLNLTNFSTNKDAIRYKLISIISHEGRSILSGHYISHCLQPDQTWSTYDDEYINKINEFQALNDPSAYVLVYSKLTPK